MGRLPTFIVIGAMKSGTTSFASYLDQHPEVAVSKPKEPNFFADPGNWDRGIDWYTSLFSTDVLVAGEASVMYTMVPEFVGAPDRIRQTIPDVRLLYLVRDPIERMRSMFVHRAEKHQARAPSFSEAIVRNPAYLAISHYDRQLEPYLDLFNEEQILVLTTDELRADPDALLARSFRHIRADPTIRIATNEVLNIGAGKKYLSDLGFRLAGVIHKTGVRNRVPLSMRRTIKHWLSFEITEELLHLEGRVERELRNGLAPEMEVTRRMVRDSGAEIPGWLQNPWTNGSS
jgi:hypothetical protein